MVLWLAELHSYIEAARLMWESQKQDLYWYVTYWEKKYLI